MDVRIDFLFSGITQCGHHWIDTLGSIVDVEPSLRGVQNAIKEKSRRNNYDTILAFVHLEVTPGIIETKLVMGGICEYDGQFAVIEQALDSIPLHDITWVNIHQDIDLKIDLTSEHIRRAAMEDLLEQAFDKGDRDLFRHVAEELVLIDRDYGKGGN